MWAVTRRIYDCFIDGVASIVAVDGGTAADLYQHSQYCTYGHTHSVSDVPDVSENMMK